MEVPYASNNIGMECRYINVTTSISHSVQLLSGAVEQHRGDNILQGGNGVIQI
jgi:hypothetical protein